MDWWKPKSAALSSTPARSVVARVATPPLSLQLGRVTVAGLWGEALPVAGRWLARRTARARWGPIAPVHRQIWEDAGRPRA